MRTKAFVYPVGACVVAAGLAAAAPMPPSPLVLYSSAPAHTEPVWVAADTLEKAARESVMAFSAEVTEISYGFHFSQPGQLLQLLPLRYPSSLLVIKSNGRILGSNDRLLPEGRELIRAIRRERAMVE